MLQEKYVKYIKVSLSVGGRRNNKKYYFGKTNKKSDTHKTNDGTNGDYALKI
jgi:hypothetical protein